MARALVIGLFGVVALLAGAWAGQRSLGAADGGWGARVCAAEVSARGCAPAWLALLAGLLLVATGVVLLVAAVRERRA
ncbi:hypothetical protein [Actinokineospora bangkokensis]|uniref:Uncharacterized protein n=1 Tax=Actinokineospora bangkokensis TaxID=1193682 RepID=A0A1Q9LGB1_9PSEU|nr:hypothetical protein [Actinokineospora bangkokensis]OLR90989.1 hypothetical protein BJP25_31055 [Actinokineospora bangkokensis]